MNRRSKFYKLASRIDTSIYVFRGLIPDFEKLDFVYAERPLFSDEGLIKISLSVFPGTDRALKTAVKELGGWELIVSPSFVVTEEVYAKLEQAGLSRQQFDKTREYLADPSGYARTARDQRYGSSH